MHANIAVKSRMTVVRESARTWIQTPATTAALILAGETLSFLLAIAGSFLLQFDFVVPQPYLLHFKFACLVVPLVKLVTFSQMGLERRWWRYFSVYDLQRLVLGNVTGSLLCLTLILGFGPAGFPRSIYLLDFLLALVISGGSRVVVRLFVEMRRKADKIAAKRAIIYGAGKAGLILLNEIRQNPALRYEIIGFVDDDPRKLRLNLAGSKILGAGSSLPWLARSFKIDEVLIAIPSATGAQMTAILRTCEKGKLKYKTVPGLGELIGQANLGKQIRPVAVEDLLGRKPVHLDQPRIAGRFRGEVVLVTGAAGSIGSELCRQIARFTPGLIVAFDIAETALYYLEREFQEKFPQTFITSEIGSIQDRSRLRELFARYRPKTVFHAAAFKHVPLMETHPFEALENNVLGTYTLATTAEEFRVEAFVLISSDKAVRPTNVMGATKRLAELITLGFEGTATKFVAVRFGNVIGSNGSVIPIFQQQIRQGGPVTVTHPEMRRYFMTIPEAAQLVLQASVMGRGGEIFVLDMGELVRIQDLATNLILLSGLKPGDDIRIEFTGMRPGEKLYEETHFDNENVRTTHHPRIKIFRGARLSPSEVDKKVRDIQRIVLQREVEPFVDFCRQAIPDYQPSNIILDGIKQPSQTAQWHSTLRRVMR
jgi:FlaA1/EpsC-like NDP-sugar epimerase